MVQCAALNCTIKSGQGRIMYLFPRDPKFKKNGLWGWRETGLNTNNIPNCASCCIKTILSIVLYLAAIVHIFNQILIYQDIYKYNNPSGLVNFRFSTEVTTHLPVTVMDHWMQTCTLCRMKIKIYMTEHNMIMMFLCHLNQFNQEQKQVSNASRQCLKLHII